MRIASAVVCTISTLTILAACSGDEVTVGKNDQALTTKKDGTPTGDGTTCSWAGNDATNGTSSSYSLGQDFGSLDGCNDCTCTADGIMCTIRTCRGSADAGSGSADAGPHACPALAIFCKPGTKPGPPEGACGLSTSCVPDDTACSTEAKLCPDGKTSVGRTGADCAFAPCP